MQLSSKMLYRTAILLMGLLLVCGLVLAFNANRQASATPADDWETVRAAVDGYITNQFGTGADQGEGGFTTEAGSLEARLDPNGDWDYTAATAPAKILGEGDNAANAPVLVDNLIAQNNVIPGTSVRCTWNGTSGPTGTGCLESAAAGLIASKANDHAEAGFTTDIVVYCLTAHTETPAVGGLGITAAGGGLGPNNPQVRGLKWGRNGWTNTPKTYSAANTKGTPGAPGSYTPLSALPSCSGQTGGELVRCMAAWAISATGGNVSNGNATWAAGLQNIDVRTGDVTGIGIPSTTSASSVQIPIDRLFKANDGDPGTIDISNLNPSNTTKHLFIGRTQLGGITAIGAEMLGYDSAFLQWGFPNYNATLDEKQVTNLHPNYSTIAATAGDTDAPMGGPGTILGVDNTPADVTGGPTYTNLTSTSVDINRVTNEPATSKIVVSDGVNAPITVNETVLNSNKTVTVGGLLPSTTYTGTLTAYDGQANHDAGSAVAVSFTTAPPPCTPAKPVLTLTTHYAFWASYADYLAHSLSVKLIVADTANDAYDVNITGSNNNNGVTLSTATPIALGNIAAGSSVETTVVYNVGSATQFTANVQGTAKDVCNTPYNYGV